MKVEAPVVVEEVAEEPIIELIPIPDTLSPNVELS
jgi:hypothetical protein